jgi:hypothetical protein
MSEYLSRPLLDIRPDFKAITSGQLDDFTCQSVGLGLATPWKVTSGPKRTVAMEFLFGTAAQAAEFRRFFGARHSRRTGFWLPIWLNEYRVVSDAIQGATSITVGPSELGSTIGSFSSFQHLALATWGKLECYEIDSVTPDGDNEVITLTSGLSTALVADQTTCGGLLWARLGDDRLVFRHKNDLVCRVQTKFVELPTEYTTEHEGSAPIYLYLVEQGSSSWRYANWAFDLEIGATTWEAADITHTAVSAGIDLVNRSVQIRTGTTDADHPFRRFKDRLLVEPMTVTIYRTDLDTLTLDTSQPVYVGRVERAPFLQKGVIEAELSSIFRVGEFEAPRIMCQRLCNNRVYDEVCGLDEADFTESGTITAIDSGIVLPYVDAVEFGAKATAESDPNWFALGKVTVGSEVRLCVGQDGDRLYLNAPFQDAAVTDAVSATAGCDRRVGTCFDKFDNDRLLGFPYIPNTNPNADALLRPQPTGGKKA